MKQFAALAARGKRLMGKAKQSRNYIAKAISLVALVAVLSGFFYLIALSSSSSFNIAKNSKNPALKQYGNLINLVQAKEQPVETESPHVACNEPLPTSSVANPTLVIFKLEKMCDHIQVDAQQEISSEELADDEQHLEQRQLSHDIEPFLNGTPMEQMIEPISAQPRIVAAYLVGIAKKESQLGKYAPSKNGRDCFNYWGYKGKEDPVAGGYSCFSSPAQAVETVGARLEKFAIAQKRDNPAKMLIWKCGSSCETHSPQSVAKWVSDVSGPFNKINSIN